MLALLAVALIFLKVANYSAHTNNAYSACKLPAPALATMLPLSLVYLWLYLLNYHFTFQKVCLCYFI